MKDKENVNRTLLQVRRYELFVPAEGETALDIADMFYAINNLEHITHILGKIEFVMEDVLTPYWQSFYFNVMDMYEIYHIELDMSFMFSSALVLEGFQEFPHNKNCVLCLMSLAEDTEKCSLYLLNANEAYYTKICDLSRADMDNMKHEEYADDVFFLEVTKNINLN